MNELVVVKSSWRWKKERSVLGSRSHDFGWPVNFGVTGTLLGGMRIRLTRGGWGGVGGDRPMVNILHKKRGCLSNLCGLDIKDAPFTLLQQEASV